MFCETKKKKQKGKNIPGKYCYIALYFSLWLVFEQDTKVF